MDGVGQDWGAFVQCVVQCVVQRVVQCVRQRVCALL